MTDLSKSFTTITEVMKSSEPMATFITREVNLFLDVLRVYGKRDKLSETDLHVLFSRLLDLAQVQPLPTPEPGAAAVGIEFNEAGKPVPIDMDNLRSEIEQPSPVVKMYAPKPRPSKPTQIPPEASDEARL